MRIHKIRPAKLFIYTVIRLDIRYDASERLIWLMLRVNCLTIVGPGHGANRKQRIFARYRRPTRLWELWGQPQHPIHRFRGVDEKKTNKTHLAFWIPSPVNEARNANKHGQEHPVFFWAVRQPASTSKRPRELFVRRCSDQPPADALST